MVELDRVRVVGREKPEAVHVLLGDEKLAGDVEFCAFAEGHAKMLADYRTRDWDAAEAACQSVAGNYGLGKLYDLYRQRITNFRTNDPGAGWDGVYSSTEK